MIVIRLVENVLGYICIQLVNLVFA